MRSSAPSSVESRIDGGAKGEVGRPFVLSEGLPPVPHKLAARIIRGEYIDMAELLRDNLEVQRRAASTPSQTQGSSFHQKHRREIPDLLSWVRHVYGSTHQQVPGPGAATLGVPDANRPGGPAMQGAWLARLRRLFSPAGGR